MTVRISDIVETVAKAINDAVVKFWHETPNPVENVGDIRKIQARAAIDACHAVEMLEALKTVAGCFDAAYVEGLAEKLAEAEVYDTGSLADLVNRRLLYAFPVVQSLLAKIENGAA